MEESKSLTYPQVITLGKYKYILIRLTKYLNYGSCNECSLSYGECRDSTDLRKNNRICRDYDEYYIHSSLFLINYITSGQYKRFLQDNS